MIGGVIIQGNHSNNDDRCVPYYHTGKRYGPLDVIATLCMSIGLVFFTLADSIIQPNFNVTGGRGKLY